MEMKKYVPQIKEMDGTVFWTEFGNHSRIELKNSSFGIGKVNIGLQKFDDNNKQVAYVNAYLDFDKAMVLANDILAGKFARIAAEMHQKDGNNMVAIYKQPGGQSAEKAGREDGKPLYREFSISHGKLWIISCQEGPGQVSKTGGFMPDGKYEKKVSVGLSNESLKAMALMIQAEYQAYRTAQFNNLLIKELFKLIIKGIKLLIRILGKALGLKIDVEKEITYLNEQED